MTTPKEHGNEAWFPENQHPTSRRCAAVIWLKDDSGGFILGPYPSVFAAKKARSTWVYSEAQQTLRPLLDLETEKRFTAPRLFMSQHDAARQRKRSKRG